ncbi:hypothetical protein QBC36DRAFT_357078 [Triangularia setosa]|uniref:Uncharacterized protein n=1 Tax=Triangularia setosa TaxID=2587417 RepID=A0AAN6W577_9PEZI|nr:hypothetical protein QBC36DRAFT_357078 [Podospora setosa]
MLPKILLAIVSLLTQTAYTAQAPIDGYGVVAFQFDMPIDPANATSDTLLVTGTIQQAIAQMEASYPGWSKSFTNSLSQRNFSAASLSSRGAKPSIIPESYNCWGRWKACQWNAIADGIEYLWRLPIDPKPQNGPGPRKCGKVSCSYNSAIWWCNDNAVEKTLRWIEIAGGAEYMNGAYGDHWNNKGQCVQDSGGHWTSAGQAFYPGNWNVILNADTC